MKRISLALLLASLQCRYVQQQFSAPRELRRSCAASNVHITSSPGIVSKISVKEPEVSSSASTLTVTPTCFQNIARINLNEGFKNSERFLRLSIESGGCQGFVYKFRFDSELIPEEDIVYTDNSGKDAPRFVIDNITITKLDNAQIDYHEELKGSAFVVKGNQLVDHSCSCAMSFALRSKRKH